MLKKNSILFSLIVLTFFNCSSDSSVKLNSQPPEIVFTKTYGGSKNEVAQSVVETSDSGYVVLGYTQSVDGDISTNQTTVQYDFWILMSIMCISTLFFFALFENKRWL